MAATLLALVAASWLAGPPGCPASPRRPSGVHAPQRCLRMTSTPPREMDPRGFVVPQVGDVVKVPSKWPGEWDVAQVDFVQFVSSRQAYEVDLLPLKSIGQSMYRLPGRKPAAVRADVAKLSRLAATYVRASDAYQIDEAELQPLGGTRRSSVLKAPPWWRHSSPYQDQDGSGLPYPNPGGAPRRHFGFNGKHVVLPSCCANVAHAAPLNTQAREPRRDGTGARGVP